MKIELDLSDVSFNYLTELSKVYKTTPEDIIDGLIMGLKDLNCRCKGCLASHR
jgi:hypothetical protein